MTAEAQPVFLVATGETHNGQETYTRHDARPPLCDAETLWPTPRVPTLQALSNWIMGVRVDGDRVIVTMKGHRGERNDVARRVCGALVGLIDKWGA